MTYLVFVARDRLGRVMSHKSETPFDNIESSHEYVALLAETIEETRLDVEAEIVLATAENATRRKEALQLVSHNLAKLSLHMTASCRILNDLRTLRCLLLGEHTTVTRNGVGR
jgi:phospholipid N-methyltransferase